MPEIQNDHERFREHYRTEIEQLEQAYPGRQLADRTIYRCFKSATFFYKTFPDEERRKEMLKEMDDIKRDKKRVVNEVSELIFDRLRDQQSYER